MRQRQKMKSGLSGLKRPKAEVRRGQALAANGSGPFVYVVGPGSRPGDAELGRHGSESAGTAGGFRGTGRACCDAVSVALGVVTEVGGSMRGSPHPGQPVMGHLLPIQECTVVGVNVPSGVDQVRI